MNHTTIDFVLRLEIPNTIRSPFLVFFMLVFWLIKQFSATKRDSKMDL
jgi:hypothetical protein